MAEYWYNLYTQQVEESPQEDFRKLLGPYATREEAQNALQHAKENTDRWDAEDASYRGD